MGIGMSESINGIILAAGKGSRLKIKTPKPLCQIMGSPLVNYVLKNVIEFGKESQLEIGVVVGHQKERVQGHIVEDFGQANIHFVTQEEQLGTGHALQVYFKAYPEAWEQDFTLITCADTPLITYEVYNQLLSKLKESGLDAVTATFFLDDPKGYGRIVKAEKGFCIVEEKDACEEEKLIQEVNSGVYLLRTSYVKKHLASLKNENNSGEFYLTDLMKVGEPIDTVSFKEKQLFLGVNDLVQLDQARFYLQKRINEKHMRQGVQIINQASVYIEPQVQLSPGVILYSGVHLIGDTIIEEGAIIETGTVIKDSQIAHDTTIKAYSYLEKVKVGKKAMVGPMARLREGSNIGDECRVGNFVETKKSSLAAGSKVSHLSYIGDAEVGENTNIGCGFITCNYDGADKHKTIIGENSFIGSDCQVIAPITIGPNCYIGSGSTINQDVPDGAFAIARQRQETKEGMAKRFLKTKKDA